MAILEQRRDRGVILRVLLATGLGALFGFQGWRLAVEGYPVPMPWYGAVWVAVRHIGLGFVLGITGRRSTSWLKRGIAFGALFSLPSVIGLGVLNTAWIVHAIALSGGSIAAGVIIAFLTDLICPARPTQHGEPDGAAQKTSAVEASIAQRDGSISRRLEDAKRILDNLEGERKRRRDPAFGHADEDRIVWRELIDLELQEIDSQLKHHHGEGQ